MHRVQIMIASEKNRNENDKATIKWNCNSKWGLPSLHTLPLGLDVDNIEMSHKWLSSCRRGRWVAMTKSLKARGRWNPDYVDMGPITAVTTIAVDGIRSIPFQASGGAMTLRRTSSRRGAEARHQIPPGCHQVRSQDVTKGQVRPSQLETNTQSTDS